MRLAEEGAGAFQALVNAILAQQQDGSVRGDDPLRLAQFIWSTVHGIATLTIDGLLQRQETDADALVRFAIERIRTGIAS